MALSQFADRCHRLRSTGAKRSGLSRFAACRTGQLRTTPPIAFGELDHHSYHFAIPSLDLHNPSEAAIGFKMGTLVKFVLQPAVS